MNIIGHKNIFLGLSAVLVGAAIVVMLVFGLRPGIEFTSGTLWQFSARGGPASGGKISQAPSLNDLNRLFKTDFGIAEATITYNLTDNSFLARLPIISEADHQKFLQVLKDKYPSFEEINFWSIGPSVSGELKRSALTAIVLVLVAISLYIAFAFRKVSKPVSSWKYGLITLITLFHDVAIPAGLLAVLGRYSGIEIDSNFVVAILVVMGFSVHDTIVVFDRIRENLSLDRGSTRLTAGGSRTDFGTLINRSVNQTIARSINTSLTLILVLLAIYFAGPTSLQYFVLTLLVGVTTGIYSSIFVASPLLFLWR